MESSPNSSGEGSNEAVETGDLLERVEAIGGSDADGLLTDADDAALEPPPRGRNWGFLDIALALVVAAAALFLSTLVSQAAYTALAPVAGWPEFSLEALAENGVYVLAVQAVWWLCVIGFVYWLLTRRYGLGFSFALRLDGRADIGHYLPLGVLLAFTVGAVSIVLPKPAVETPFEQLLDDRTTLAALGLFAVFVAPAVEELFFRGFLFEPFEQRMGPLVAVLATSLPFTLVHGDQYAWQWQHMALLTGVAAVFGILRSRTQSLWPPILVHAGFNATQVVGTYLALGQQ